MDVLPCWQPCADVYQSGMGCQYHGVATAGEGLLVDKKAVTDVKCKKIGAEDNLSSRNKEFRLIFY